jgi:hypothetical protein
MGCCNFSNLRFRFVKRLPATVKQLVGIPDGLYRLLAEATAL